jgi:F-type H+-transporting ATPase subunit delta
MSLRGASAEARAGLLDQQDRTLGAGTGDAARLGDDLFAVASVLRSEPGLRRVATEASHSPESKASLVRSIFAGKVDDVVLDLVATAAGRRWTTGRDLGLALEQLGVVATVRSAGSDTDRLSDELFSVGRLVKDNPSLRDALSDPARSIADKRGLVHNLLEGKALPATIALVAQALAGTHRTVGVALHEYERVAAAEHGRRVAEVRVAHPLTDADRQRLTDALSRQYDREVHLNVVVDPDVIGGIRVEIGDDVIDGTVSNRLHDARRQLAG